MVYHRDGLGRVICNIRTPMGNREEVGTAIFIAKGEALYLITAAHVAKNITPHTYIILSDDKGSSMKVGLNNILQGARFENHPIADLSKARIIGNPYNIHLLKERFFPYDHIDVSENLISKDIQLTTIGFPLGLGTEGAKFTPLSYRTFAAASAISLNRSDTATVNDFIILELPSVGGYSGGPVFDLGYMESQFMKMSGEKTILHGIVHGTISDPTGGKLAAITPTKYLKDWL